MLTVYTKNNCSFCMLAKNLLKKKEIAFEEVNVEDDEDSKMFLISQGHRTMPQIYQGDELFVEGGYSGLMEKLDPQVDTSQLGSL